MVGRFGESKTSFHTKKIRTTVKAKKLGTSGLHTTKTTKPVYGKTEHVQRGNRVTQGRSYRGAKSGRGR